MHFFLSLLREYLDVTAETQNAVCESQMRQLWMERELAGRPFPCCPPETRLAQSTGYSALKWAEFIIRFCLALSRDQPRSRKSLDSRGSSCQSTCSCLRDRCGRQRNRGLKFYIRSNETEFVRIQDSLKLLSIKSQVDVPGHGSFVREESWVDPPAEPPSFNGWKRVNRKTGREYDIWFPTSITIVDKAHGCGYSEEIWASLTGAPRPMRGSVIRTTSHHGMRITRRSRDLDLGELVWVIENPVGRLWAYCCSSVCQGFERGKSAVEELLWDDQLDETELEELD